VERGAQRLLRPSVGVTIESATLEHGRAPAGLQLVEQPVQPPFTVTRARPPCEWPQWPRYRGSDPSSAAGFVCTQ